MTGSICCAQPTAVTLPSMRFKGRGTDRMLDQLDDRSRSILRAVAYEGTKLADLGPRFGLSEGAAQVALHCALSKLYTLRRGGQ